MIDILLISDDDEIVIWLQTLFQNKNFTLNVCTTGADGIDAFYEKRPHLVLLSAAFLKKPSDSILILQNLKQQAVFLPVIIILDNVYKEKASLFKKYGAFDFIEKTFCFEQVQSMIDHSIKIVQVECSSQINASLKEITYIGAHKLKERIEALKNDPINVVVGSQGAQKVYVAELLHCDSETKDGPFVTVDKTCSDYDKALFGYEIKSTDLRKIGGLEQADKGSLYIENIENLPKSAQKKILDYCESGKFVRLGSATPISVQVKLIFGSTLSYYQLSQYVYPEFLSYIWNTPIILAPLKERPEDIKSMIQFIGNQIHTSIMISDDALNALQAYSWPYDIKELELLAQTFLLKEKDTMELCDLPGYMTRTMMSNEWLTMKFKEAKEEFEKVYIQYHVLKYRNNISYIANIIGLDRTALYRKMKNLGM